ncbi:MAG: hypothetical protein R2690_09010 [Acidimicrobiales bacterium]
MLETLTDDALTPLLWSLGLGAAVALSAAAIGIGLAWCTTRTDLPGRRAAAVLGPLPLVVPSYVGAAALVAGFAPVAWSPTSSPPSASPRPRSAASGVPGSC